ncbi:hypothetical protein MBLNU230_g0197t1 [Neophaeotheca triangularis]
MAPPSPPEAPRAGNRARAGTGGSVKSAANSVRSVGASLLEKDLPHGFLAATAEATAKAPTISDIRRGSYGSEGWNGAAQMERRRSSASDGRPGGVRRTSSGMTSGSGRVLPRRRSSGTPLGSPTDQGENEEPTSPFPALVEEPGEADRLSSKQSRWQDDKMRRSTEDYEEEQVEYAGQHYTNNKDATTDSAGSLGDKQPDLEIHEKRRRPEKKQDDEPHFIRNQDRAHSSGYIPPPKIPWTTSTVVGTKAFLKWFITPFGFLLTVYGLNVVAWGGMLFLLLLNAAPAMCSQDTPENNFDGCNDIGSPRRIWVEHTSQILNALFCVTGFGLIPWRFRDFYYLLRWRLCSEKKKGREQKLYGMRKLAGFHRNWFRLPGSDTLDEFTASEYERSIYTAPKPAPGTSSTTSSSLHPTTTDSTTLDDLPTSDPRLPLPLSKTPLPPLTGVRAPPTAPWKLDFFIWCQIWNTIFQSFLAGFMWGMDRFERPPWSTGLFVALACIIAAVGGIMSFVEGKKVKKVEGVGERETPAESAIDGDDVEMGKVKVGDGREAK